VDVFDEGSLPCLLEALELPPPILDDPTFFSSGFADL